MFWLGRRCRNRGRTIEPDGTTERVDIKGVAAETGNISNGSVTHNLLSFRNDLDGSVPVIAKGKLLSADIVLRIVPGNTPSGHGLHECLCSHAEENSIVQAAYHGIAVKGATLYTTFSPCLQCAKMIINAGIVEVVYHQRYSIDDVSTRLLKEAGIIIRPLREDDENAEK